MSNYNRIILKERVRIEAGIYAKKSFGEIAEELGRSTSSITREVRQNRIMVKSPYACGTDCVYPRIVGRQVFAEMSIVPRGVGHAQSMIVRSIAIDALHIPAKRQRRHRLYVIPVVRRIRKHVSTISIITLQKRLMQRRKRSVQNRGRVFA